MGLNAANNDQNSNGLDYEFPDLEDIISLDADVQKEFQQKSEVTYSASAVKEMVNNAVNNAVKGVHEGYADQIAALKAQIETKDKGKGKMIEPEREPTHTTFPAIHPELATSSSQEIVSPISQLEGKIVSLRTEMYSNLTKVVDSLINMHSQIQTLETTCQTTMDLSKRKNVDQDDPIRRGRKNNKKVRLDFPTLAGTSAGASTHADTSYDVAISSDRVDGDDGQESQRNSEPLSFENLQKHFEIPLKKTAKALKISSTGLKKKCRELGISRWPYRKLSSLKWLIENLKDTLSRERIEMLKENRRMIKENPEVELTPETTKLRLAYCRSGYKKRKKLLTLIHDKS